MFKQLHIAAWIAITLTVTSVVGSSSFAQTQNAPHSSKKTAAIRDLDAQRKFSQFQILAHKVGPSVLNAISALGIQVSLTEYHHRLGLLLTVAKERNMIPGALTLGLVGRMQGLKAPGLSGKSSFSLGANFGVQVNLFYEGKKIRYSIYRVYGPQAGFAYVRKLEFFSAACFGSCFGGGAEGFFGGIDGYAYVGSQGGFFVEGGMDLTEFMDRWFGPPPPPKARGFMDDIVHNGVVYAGYGFDVGMGIGFAATLMRYELLVDGHIPPESSAERIARLLTFYLASGE